jgi:hypothetical protein
MSVTKELKERAAMALQALRRGDQAEAERLLEADAKGFMPGPTPDLTSDYEVTKLQADFQTMRRRAGGIAAAMCIVAPQRDKPGAFRFHFSGHDAVVALLQGKAGLKVSPTPPPALDADGNPIPPAEEPVDELAAYRAKRAEIETQQPHTTP